MDMIGKVLKNRYEVKKQIGEGGMAKVFLAHDVFLKRDIALKILKPETLSDASSMERFKKEITAATNLIHTNVVQVFDVDYANDSWYIAMELVDGKTLKEILRSEGAMIPKAVSNIGVQLCSAIKKAHSIGIIHRDIKPQNVMVKSDGTVKLMDFGIATIVNSATITKTDAIVGSVQYIAPEIVKGSKPSFASDIYSIGILLFEMLRGDLPFVGETPIQIALQHISKKLPELRKYNNNIPQALENAVIRATAKKPVNRYHDAGALSMDLTEAFGPDKANVKPLKLNEFTSNNMKKASHTMLISNTGSIRIPWWITAALAIIALGSILFIMVT